MESQTLGLEPPSIRVRTSRSTTCWMRWVAHVHRKDAGRPIYPNECVKPKGGNGSPHNLFAVSEPLIHDYATFNTAPTGSSSNVTYFHNATKSLRANATTPTFRFRRLPGP